MSKHNFSSNKNKTKKIKKGGLAEPRFKSLQPILPGDSKITGIQCNGNPISCTICGKQEFQARSATFGKSKLQSTLMSMLIISNTLNDISTMCYFCNNCGNCITVRDPKSPVPGTYQNLIIPGSITNAPAAAPVVPDVPVSAP